MRLDDVATWARERALAVGAAPESPENLAAVHAWREAWRPKRVRVLLVAESHVAPLDGDAAVRVHADAGGARVLPERYTRLVYCLGYGEDSMCSPSPRGNGSGTWQYWDLFGQLARGLGQTQPRKAQSTAAARMRWKVDTLELLRDRGIWLADASVMALYAGSRRRVANPKRCTAIVRESWERFVWPDVEGDRPEEVWIVGRGVASALAGAAGLREIAGVIDQPQSREVARYQSGVAEMVQRVQAVSVGPAPRCVTP